MAFACGSRQQVGQSVESDLRTDQPINYIPDLRECDPSLSPLMARTWLWGRGRPELAGHCHRQETATGAITIPSTRRFHYRYPRPAVRTRDRRSLRFKSRTRSGTAGAGTRSCWTRCAAFCQAGLLASISASRRRLGGRPGVRDQQNKNKTKQNKTKENKRNEQTE